jgi:hypothetical protein
MPWWLKRKRQDDLQTEVESPPALPIPSKFGLQILHDPLEIAAAREESLQPGVSSSAVASNEPLPALIDVIFVHGLGGSSRGTWTHPESGGFWPEWLQEKSGLENVRISTFGYDANWGNITAPSNGLGIADFARQLLDALDLHYVNYGNVRSLSLHLLMFRLLLSSWRTAWAV